MKQIFNMTSLKKIIDSGEILVADGAMATSLYEQGFYINRSFEELSLTEPQAVREVIRKFKKAGTRIFHTNTFNATRPKLTKYGLQNQLADIVKKSAELALESAGDDGFVLGLLGPLGVLVEPLGPTSLQEAEDLYFEIAQHLAQSGVHGIAINGLHDKNELVCAIHAVRRVCTLPLFVNIGVNESLRTSYGHSLKDLAELAEKYNLDVIGICGEIGPSTMLTAIEELTKITKRPIMALPNAGLPRYVNDQYIYLCNPDYIGKFAKRFIQAGAQIVGGHSGVYDTHIQAIRNAVRMVGSSNKTGNKKEEAEPDKKVTKKLPSNIKPIVDSPTEPLAIEKRSLLGEHLKNNKRIVTVELVPPALNEFDKFISRCRELDNAGVEFVNIPDGARAMARISSIHLAHHVKQNFKIEPIPHFTCRDRNLIGLQSELLGAHISGVHNLLLITGDPPKLGNNPGASAVYDVDSIGLTHIVTRMNAGLDMGGSHSAQQTNFVVGVALNPTSKNVDLEISRFKFKVEAGCEYAITQPIYNVDAYKKFIDLAGVNLPIIMGIWPLVSLRNAEFLKYEVPGVDVPDWVIEEMQKAGESKEEALKRGIEIAMRTIEAAKIHVAGFQISAPFNKASVAIEVIQSVLR